MAEVTVKINERDYQVVCDDGEEHNLAELAAILDNRIKKIVSVSGQVGDARLLVMASLLLVDDLKDLQSKLEDDCTSNAKIKVNDKLGNSIEEMAKRIENIAERIEQA